MRARAGTPLFVAASFLFLPFVGGDAEAQRNSRLQDEAQSKRQRQELSESRRAFGFDVEVDTERLKKRREKLREMQRHLDIEQAGRGVDVEAGYERIDEQTIRR